MFLGVNSNSGRGILDRVFSFGSVQRSLPSFAYFLAREILMFVHAATVKLATIFCMTLSKRLIYGWFRAVQRHNSETWKDLV